MSLFDLDFLDRSYVGQLRTRVLFRAHQAAVFLTWRRCTVKDYLNYKMVTGPDKQGEMALMMVKEFRRTSQEDDAYEDIYNLRLTSHVGMMIKEVLDRTFDLCLTLDNWVDRQAVIDAAVHSCNVYMFS